MLSGMVFVAPGTSKVVIVPRSAPLMPFGATYTSSPSMHPVILDVIRPLLFVSGSSKGCASRCSSNRLVVVIHGRRQRELERAQQPADLRISEGVEPTAEAAIVKEDDRAD